MSTTPAPVRELRPEPNLPDLSGQTYRAGFAALRIMFGINWLSNAVAKLLDTGRYGSGFVTFNLVDRGTAKGILEQATGATPIAPLRAFYTDVVLANWSFFSWFLTLTEVAIGLGLLFGVATRLAALGGIALLLPVWIMLLGTNQYLWTYPLDILPLVLLAIVPAGRTWGLDARLVGRFGRRWPF